MHRIRKRHWLIAGFGLACLLVPLFAYFPDRFPGVTFLKEKLRGRATVADRLTQYGPAARARWLPYFEKQHLNYPPRKLLLVGLKREKQLQVYAADDPQRFQLVRTLPILGLSGKLGPKLRFGDLQVPEGFYRIESLNPNSAFHLALRVNYPNAFDRAQAQREGRTELGGDIMIHGSRASIGCLAMGDAAAEDLFVLAAQTKLENIQLLISPVDFRLSSPPPDTKRPAWVSELYSRIKAALTNLPE